MLPSVPTTKTNPDKDLKADNVFSPEMLNTFPHQFWISCKWYDSFLCPSTFIPYCLSLFAIPEGRMQRRWSQAPFSGAQWKDQKKGAQTETWEAPSEHQGTLFHCEGDRALAQLTLGGCGVSILGDIQKLSGHGPRQPGLGDSAWAWGLGQVTSRGSSQHILRFCFTDPRNSSNTHVHLCECSLINGATVLK